MKRQLMLKKQQQINFTLALEELYKKNSYLNKPTIVTRLGYFARKCPTGHLSQKKKELSVNINELIIG